MEGRCATPSIRADESKQRKTTLSFRTMVSGFFLLLSVMTIIISMKRLLPASTNNDSVVSSPHSNDKNNSSAFLEPTVSLIRGVLPPHVCKELIDIGEKEGFNVQVESIDDLEEGYKASGQSIDVYERYAGIGSTNVWDALQPWIPQLTELVKNSIDSAVDAHFYPDQPNRAPKLDWIFFRKYSPDTERNSLLLHVDSNMHTLNIALNDDFVGGGLMYVKPELALQDENVTSFYNDSRPIISDEYRTYDWLNNIKRQNTSDIVFPSMGTGDVLIHNFTVWHAVAPLEMGSRYSLVLFYDMDNPAIQGDFYPSFDVAFYHEIMDVEIDLVWVENIDGLETVHVMVEKMPPFKEVIQETIDEHVFRAMISGTDTVLAEFEMKTDQKLCVVTMNKEFIGGRNQSSSCDNSDVFLEPTVSLIRGVLPPHVCKELIDIGEREGFNDSSESIDENEKGYKASGQYIEVLERFTGIRSPNVWDVLQPWIPQLTELVKNSIDSAVDAHFYPNQPNRVPKLDWIFFRKYSPDTERNSLLLHVDSNMHTLNIALNDDFVGGGLMYVKPELALQDEELISHVNDSRPIMSQNYNTYDWLNNIKRQNTSDIVFPSMGTGDVLIHNFTVYHAVAPLKMGTRYSLILFYDMDNPAVEVDFYSSFDVAFYHEIKDVEIDLVWVKSSDGLETVHVMVEKMPPFQKIIQETFDEHVFRAMISGTDTVLAEFVMSSDQKLCTITAVNENPREEL